MPEQPRTGASSPEPRYLAAALAGDRRGALRVMLEAHEDGADLPALRRVIADAQREIGRLWQEDRISIAQEHMATAISQVVLAHLFQHAPPVATNGKRVVVACVEGELHDFPARLVADALDLAGFDVRFLGANVPIKDLLSRVAAEAPDLLALSATMAFHAPALRASVTAVRAAMPALPIAVGGNATAWMPGLVDELGVEVCASDADELILAAQRVLGIRGASARVGA